MEKGNEVAGGVQTAPGANAGAAAAAAGGGSTTSPHAGTGTGTKEAPSDTPSTAPSGSITHPEGIWEKATLAKDADGTWRYTSDETGQSWIWDAAGNVWRGEGGAQDISGEEVGGPEDQAAFLSGVGVQDS